MHLHLESTHDDVTERGHTRRPSRAPHAGARIVERLHTDPAQARDALIAGLRARPARVSSKYFYDDLGCELFGAICRLPEYYPTRTERWIFDTYRDSIAHAIGAGGQFVDLGAGDCRKGEQWLSVVAAKRYVAVDIAAHALRTALARLEAEFPAIEMRGLVADFTCGLDLYADLDDMPTTFFYPGSSIGNFTPGEAIDFLQRIRRHCTTQGSGLLIGVDTKKAKSRLDAAYDDALGVTAAFNRNVLNHVNRILDSNFAIGAFEHRGFYNEYAGRIEMHLEAATAQTVLIDREPRRFASGERILTEYSYKYAPAEFAEMLNQAGFDALRCWQDPAGDYAVFHAR